jgi:NADH-quinone oxidoreductase subunit E
MARFQKKEFSEGTLSKVLRMIGRYPEGQAKSALIPVLLIAQEEMGGYLTVDIMDQIAGLLHIQPIEVYEVATFYSMFHLEKVGRFVIEVCQTGPCAMCGGEEVLEYLKNWLQIGCNETTADGLFTLLTVECLGGCGEAPNLQINSEFHKQMTPAKIDRLLENLKASASEKKHSATTWAGLFC